MCTAVPLPDCGPSLYKKPPDFGRTLLRSAASLSAWMEGAASESREGGGGGKSFMEVRIRPGVSALISASRSHLLRQLRVSRCDAKLLHLVELMHAKDPSVLPAGFAQLSPRVTTVAAAWIPNPKALPGSSRRDKESGSTWRARRSAREGLPRRAPLSLAKVG